MLTKWVGRSGAKKACMSAWMVSWINLKEVMKVCILVSIRTHKANRHLTLKDMLRVGIVTLFKTMCI